MTKRKIDIFTLGPPPVDLSLIATSPAYRAIMGDVFKRWMDGVMDGSVAAERTVIEIDENDFNRAFSDFVARNKDKL